MIERENYVSTQVINAHTRTARAKARKLTHADLYDDEKGSLC